MMDIQEARAALIAVQGNYRTISPWSPMTLRTNGYTLSGTDPVTALITLQSLGPTP